MQWSIVTSLRKIVACNLLQAVAWNRALVYFQATVAPTHQRVHKTTSTSSIHFSTGKHVEWTEKRVLELVALYQEQPCLYDTKPELYFDRNRRTKTLNQISRKIGAMERSIIIISSHQYCYYSGTSLIRKGGCSD